MPNNHIDRELVEVGDLLARFEDAHRNALKKLKSIRGDATARRKELRRFIATARNREKRGLVSESSAARIEREIQAAADSIKSLEAIERDIASQVRILSEGVARTRDTIARLATMTSRKRRH